MKTKTSTAALEAVDNLVPTKGGTAHLRSSTAFIPSDGVEVDEKTGVIKNAAVMRVGPAQGHGFSIDGTTLKQVESLGNAVSGGVKVRFQHPKEGENGVMADDLGHVIGYVDNLKVNGETLRGDVHLEDYAEVLPGLGNVREYLLRRAKSRPESFGLSCVIGFDTEVQADDAGQVMALVARVTHLDAIDVVGRGAATPNGLLSVTKPEPTKPAAAAAPIPSPKPAAKAALTTKGKSMNPQMKQYLVTNHNLSADATDDEAMSALEALSVEDQAKCKALMSAPVIASANTAQLRTQHVTDEGDRLLAAEGKRVTQLTMLASTLKNVDQGIVDLAIASGDTFIDARKRYLAHLSDKAKPIAGASGSSDITVGTDRNIASLVAAIPDALRMKAQQTIKDPKPRVQELAQLKMLQIGRVYLAACGVMDAAMKSDMKVWEMLVRPREFASQYAALAQSTGSFSNLTLDAANKTLRQAYLDKPATWTIWARRASTPDFKNVNRISLSDAPNLVSRQDGGEIKYSNMVDGKETYVVTEYVNGIRLTRQAVVNDDMDAFGRIPMLQGYAARRKEDDVAYAILTANAALADTIALFDNATHKNYDTATANVGAPAIATLALGRLAMRKQKGPNNGAFLNLVPRFLIVPAALETVANQYTSINYVPVLAASINPFTSQGTTPLTPIVEPRLDANSAVKWYLAAGNDQIDTVEICFLADEPEPQLKQEVDFDTDDIKFAVRHTCGAKAIDYRGLYLNAGA